MHNGTNQPKIQAQRVKIAAEFTIPIKHLEIRVTRKPGDGGWIRSSVALIYLNKCSSPFTFFNAKQSFPSFYPFFDCCVVAPKLLHEHYVFMVSSYFLPYFLDHVIPP